MEGRFMAIEPAFAVPKGHSAGLRYLRMFVEELRASRRVADALQSTSTATGSIVQGILNNNPRDEEAYKAIAYLYGAIKEEQKLRDWITARAANDSIEPTKRAGPG